MVAEMWVRVTLLLSLVAGTAAFTLGLLTWEILRASAIGQIVTALIVLVALFSFYHGILLVFPEAELLVSVLKSFTFTAAALFVAFTIRFERRISKDGRMQGDP